MTTNDLSTRRSGEPIAPDAHRYRPHLHRLAHRASTRDPKTEPTNGSSSACAACTPTANPAYKQSTNRETSMFDERDRDLPLTVRHIRPAMKYVAAISGTLFGSVIVAGGEPWGWLVIGAALVAWVAVAADDRVRGDRGATRLLAVGVVGALAATAVTGCQFNTTPFLSAGPNYVTVVHEGGWLSDDCVLTMLVTGGTAVALATQPELGAVAMIASWTVVGAEGGMTAKTCLESFNDNVKQKLTDHSLVGHCYNVAQPRTANATSSGAACAMAAWIAYLGMVKWYANAYADPITATWMLVAMGSIQPFQSLWVLP